MSTIQIKNLTFCYPSGSVPVFEQVNLNLDTDWKLGVVGRNGRGKTTLLRLLCGDYEYSGTIASAVPFAYFPYSVTHKERETGEILHEICPQAEEWELMRELSWLEAEPDIMWRPFETLSNGEQTKALLAALFLRDGEFLLIDEPTNHLDAAGRETVSAYLRRKRGFLVVSHDRRFLDGCIDHVLALERTGMTVCGGTVSAWMNDVKRRQSFEQTQNDRLKRDISRLKQAAKRTEIWSDRIEASKAGAVDKGYVGHRAAKMMKRSKTMEARQQRAIEQKSALLKDVETAQPLKLSPLSARTGPLVTCRRVQVNCDGRRICGPVSFTLECGQRIALDGKNGSGKSSLLKLVLGEPIAHTGTVAASSGLVVSYVPQDTAHLRGTLAEYARQCAVDESLLKTILRKLGMERAQLEKQMQEFSEGQKKKVLIARSLCEQAHVYVWDEPLNFIDMEARGQIEQLVRSFSPTMLFVEHDRAFRDSVATERVTL